jgi:hypothetical protein
MILPDQIGHPPVVFAAGEIGQVLCRLGPDYQHTIFADQRGRSFRRRWYAQAGPGSATTFHSVSP